MTVRMDDYRKEDGNVDWDAYYTAQRNAGDICKNVECSASILGPIFGTRESGPRECYQCKDLGTNPEAVDHDRLLRCPECQHTQPADEEWEAGIHADRDGEPVMIYCNHCDAEFPVVTHVSYSYQSPPIKR